MSEYSEPILKEDVRPDIVRLIELKLDLINLENLKKQNNFIKISNRLESLKKLESYHETKLQAFKNRILFFENYLINNLNKEKSAMRTANSNRLLGIELSDKKKIHFDEIQSLKKEIKLLKDKIAKYEKYFSFIQDTVSLFSANQLSDLSQIINRFDSLKYVFDENEQLLDQSADELLSLRGHLLYSVQAHSDELLYKYETKSLTYTKLKNIRRQTSTKNEAYLKNFNQSIERLRQLDQIINSINNMYQLTNRFCKFNHKYLKERNLKLLSFAKLNIIKQNFEYLNKVSNF